MGYSIRPRVGSAVENLENRVLFSQISVADYGAVPGDGRDDHAAITRALENSGAGDTVVFGAGRYDLGQTLHLASDRTYRGAGERDTTLRFDVGQDEWGIKLDADASHLTVANFVFDGGGIALVDGEVFRDITIRDNEFINTPGGTFNNNGPAIFSGVASDGLTISGNFIHDTDNYGLILYAVDRLNLTHNTFQNLMQAGHIMDLGKDNMVSFNRLRGMIRMGFELQRHGERTAENTTVEGNVITDWRQPFRDSFGLSIVPDGSVNTRVIDNYIQGVPRGWDGEWNRESDHDDQGKRMGYGIEYGARSGEVSGNVVGGAFANHIIISGGGGQHDGVIPVRDNQLYATPVWDEWITHESFGGEGFGWRERGNLKDHNYSKMPPPGASSGSGGNDQAKQRETRDDRRAERSDQPSQPAASRQSNFKPGEFVWLSDLEWRRAESGWGPIEIDQSNGERAPRDGHTLTINGRTYEKGLGVAIDSEVVYSLKGTYDTFFSHVGIDDSVGDAGSVTFEVWADGRRIYDSGTVTGAMAVRALELKVTGVEELRLVTTDAGDGGARDHANWAGAKLVGAKSQ